MAESKVKLRSNDGQAFEVAREVAFKSETVKSLIETMEPSEAEQEIPLPSVSGNTLSKVIEFCQFQVDADEGRALVSMTEWNAEFLRVDKITLLALLEASHYLAVKKLLDLTADTVARLMKGQSIEGMRRLFTPDEEVML